MERDDIVAEMTSFRANEKLLSVLSRKSPSQFELFLDALDHCGQQHVGHIIAGRPGLNFIVAHYMVFFVFVYGCTESQFPFSSLYNNVGVFS